MSARDMQSLIIIVNLRLAHSAAARQVRPFFTQTANRRCHGIFQEKPSNLSGNSQASHLQQEICFGISGAFERGVLGLLLTEKRGPNSYLMKANDLIKMGEKLTARLVQLFRFCSEKLSKKMLLRLRYVRPELGYKYSQIGS